jgi:hypothetical protein
MVRKAGSIDNVAYEFYIVIITIDMFKPVEWDYQIYKSW